MISHISSPIFYYVISYILLVLTEKKPEGEKQKVLPSIFLIHVIDHSIDNKELSEYGEIFFFFVSPFLWVDNLVDIKKVKLVAYFAISLIYWLLRG